MTYIVHVSTNFWCSRRNITPAHQAHKSFLKPSQLPGGVCSSIAAITAHIGLIKHNSQLTALTGAHLLLGGEKQLWSSVLLKDISTMVAVGIRTHLLTAQPSEHKSDALKWSAMALHFVQTCKYPRTYKITNMNTSFSRFIKVIINVVFLS